MRASLIVGAGPGGTGPLTWAAQQGLLEGWLKSGVALFDRRAVIGGTLGRYAINSDSLGGAYLECLDAPAGQAFFAPLRDDPAMQALLPFRQGFPPLSMVDRYLHRVGALLEDAVAAESTSDFFRGTHVAALHLQADGTVVAEAEREDGYRFSVEARTAVMALGGRQLMPSHFETHDGIRIAMADLDPRKLIGSDRALTAEGLGIVERLLANADSKRIVILGGAHSAYSTAWALTRFLAHLDFGDGDIILLERRPPRIFYENAAAAESDQYPFDARDICPRTRRVNRLGGLRGDGRDIWRRIEKRQGVHPESRVRVVTMASDTAAQDAVMHLLDQAALIIPAFGYRSRTVPVFAPDGRRLALNADIGGAAVDDDARIMLADGTALPNVFGLGLGSGFVPRGAMGGEPSFNGQANSWWLYQNHIGAAVYRGIHDYIAEGSKPVRKVEPGWSADPALAEAEAGFGVLVDLGLQTAIPSG